MVMDFWWTSLEGKTSTEYSKCQYTLNIKIVHKYYHLLYNCFYDNEQYYNVQYKSSCIIGVLIFPRICWERHKNPGIYLPICLNDAVKCSRALLAQLVFYSLELDRWCIPKCIQLFNWPSRWSRKASGCRISHSAAHHGDQLAAATTGNKLSAGTIFAATLHTQITGHLNWLRSLARSVVHSWSTCSERAECGKGMIIMCLVALINCHRAAANWSAALN